MSIDANGGTVTCNAHHLEFRENIAGNSGGHLNLKNAGGNLIFNMSNCLINNGKAPYGAAFNIFKSGGSLNANISNCTFYADSANIGGAIYSSNMNSLYVSNCIFGRIMPYQERNFGITTAP